MLTTCRVQEAPATPRGTSHGAWLWAFTEPMLHEASGDVRRGRAQVCVSETNPKHKWQLIHKTKTVAVSTPLGSSFIG